MYRGLTILKLLLLLVISLQSASASLVHIFRQLSAVPNPNLPLQMSPSPTPSAAAPMDPPKTPTTTKPVVSETCDKVSKKCHHNSITACIGLQESFLLVLNDDDSPLKVNVTIVPLNITYKEIDIPRRQAKKINISDNGRGSSSIIVEAGNGVCIIHMGADGPKEDIRWQNFSYDTYMTPINGAYLLVLSALIVGGTWACCKLRKRERHLDGVQYEELEMGQSEFNSSANVETAEGWDQDWDADWDDEKAVKLPAGNHVTGRTANGHTSKNSNSDGWGNDWDD